MIDAWRFCVYMYGPTPKAVTEFLFHAVPVVVREYLRKQ